SASLRSGLFGGRRLTETDADGRTLPSTCSRAVGSINTLHDCTPGMLQMIGSRLCCSATFQSFALFDSESNALMPLMISWKPLSPSRGSTLAAASVAIAEILRSAATRMLLPDTTLGILDVSRLSLAA